MEMDIVQVDPKLFISCRLCLEDDGMYQINPTVQSQIKYCFDIDVDPFDTLPQLICDKCKDILGDYVTTKRTFVGKQNALRARMEVRKGLAQRTGSSFSKQPPPPQTGVVSSSQDALLPAPPPTSAAPASAAPASSAPARAVAASGAPASATSPSATPASAAPPRADEAHSRSASPTPTKKKKYSKRGPKSRKQPWEDGFTKSFVCRICGKRLVNQGNVIRHVKAVHGRLLELHKNVFLRSCSVHLEKYGDKPNFINSLNIVMKPNKIIADRSNTLYHVLYTKGVSTDEEEEDEQNTQSESSSDEIIIKRPHSKRPRLLSKSSTDTVCLEGVKKENEKRATLSDAESSSTPNPSHFNITEECINIEDSSDSDQDSTVSARSINTVDPKSLSISIGDYKIIQRIVSSCENKYVKKMAQEIEENATTNSDFNINNKIMNVGRKLINNSSVSCKALLRYVENKNLELEWNPILEESSNNKDNFVRIMPKLRSKKIDDDKQGWKFTSTEDDEDTEQCALFSAPKKAVDKRQAVSGIGPTLLVDTLLKEPNKKEASKEAAQVNLNDKNANKRVALHHDKESDKIILNASPVVNPKKLPKKTACPKSAKPKINNEEYSSKAVIRDDLPIAAITRAEVLHMPIITSTTSLAPWSEATEVITYEPPTPEPVADTNLKFDIALAPESTKQQHYDQVPDVHMPSFVAEIVQPSESIVETNKSNVETNKSNVETNKSNVETNKSNIEPNENKVPSSTQNVIPRIKVKPVSELMSESALNSYNSRPQESWSVNDQFTVALARPSPVLPSPVLPGTILPSRALPSPTLPSPALPNPHNQVLTSNTHPINIAPKQPEYVILDTVQFPNKKTYSPFQYLRDLLQVHNITLLDDDSKLTKSFNSLLKYKVRFGEDQLSVVLNVSMHIFENQIYIGVNIPKENWFLKEHKLSAYWQWEVIKTFTTSDNVKDKLLESAKEFGLKIYECTNTFLCVVRSIKYINCFT